MAKHRKPKGGRGARKGAGFERKICKALSLWVSRGKKTDIFWRTAMSGGRATFHRRKGVDIRQVGDICAVAPEGNAFCEKWFVECKNVKAAGLESFLLTNKGKLAGFWHVAQKEAEETERQPIILIRSQGPILAITKIGALESYTTPQLTSHARNCDVSFLSDVVFDVPEAVAALKKSKKDKD